MSKKRHVKVFVVASPDLKSIIPVEESVELNLALNSVKARCFTSYNLAKVSDTEEVDWEMKQTLTGAIISVCDAVAVVGSSLTTDMVDELKIAADEDKVICCTSNLKDMIMQKKIPVSEKPLKVICQEALSSAVPAC